MALTPTEIASQIEKAGAQGRARDHAALSGTHRELGQAIRSINGMISSALTAREQKRWIAGSAAVAMVVGFTLGAILPPWIDRAVPENWRWPERRAAEILDHNGWDAGIHLLQVSDPGQWQNLQETIKIADNNGAAGAGCRSRMTRARKIVSCASVWGGLLASSAGAGANRGRPR